MILPQACYLLQNSSIRHSWR